MAQFADFDTTFIPVIYRDYVHVGILINPDATGDWYGDNWESGIPEGNGPLVTITFTATAMPETLTVTDLTIYDIILLDSNLQEIEYDPPEQGIFQAPIRREDLNADGKIDITDISIFGLAFGSYPGHDRWNADVDIVQDNRVNILDGVQIAKAYGIYAPAVHLKVEPPSTSVAVGSEFTVSITINDLDKPLYLIALQFQVFYDPFELEVVSVTEGDFLSSFDGTWFTYEVIRDYVLVGLMKLPDETGQWGAPFPEGSGTLVTITFRCTAAGTSDLTIGNELLLDLGLDAIKNRPSVGGTVVQG
jgi:hypothetical protein